MDFDLSDSEDWAGQYLDPNLPLLSSTQIKLARMLVQAGQAHLFTNWPKPGVRDADKLRFFDQVAKLDSSYPGGLAAYVQNARKLLADSKAGKNPFSGYVPSVPDGVKLVHGEETFMQYEEAGVREAQHSAFVLVAGGLGERLGYSGIKLALPTETTTGTSFLQHYINSILALQDANNGDQGEDVKPIPLVIMTSDDTHEKTIELLKKNNNFGMLPDQIVLLKQEKVACISDNNGSLALDPSNNFLIQTKPHGHGDVHNVLYKSGLLTRWQQEGRKWVLFFQDTNALLFKGVPAALGVSALKDLDVNSLAVNRKAKEAIGGIARLTHENGSQMVINVEYNQLDPLLRSTGHPEGDVNVETGFSPFPGNINQLIFKLSSYIEELSKTLGAIVEFVNPKYKDSSKTSFKSSTRLECMMQDYPRTLPTSAKVGFTVLETWLAYAPVKNNPEDARKVPQGNPPHSATSGEMAVYRANCLILKKAGVHIEGPKVETYNGQEVEVWPRIVWSPKWGLTFSDVKRKVKGNCEISQRSTLVIDGKDVSIDDLVVDGSLLLRALVGSKVNIQSLRVSNDGWKMIPVDWTDNSVQEEIRIRGFKLERHGQQSLFFDQPGKCHINNVSM
ncbi:hypothetical protein R1sor_009300 [Riccia sorocarpa]|uniref:UTP-monosaccharide-1-phosphate uridylyltransferase n=1 Tax=Riccia sorocarpa TaxID=122646 RepID=A0ABD3I0V8_9MARC